MTRKCVRRGLICLLVALALLVPDTLHASRDLQTAGVEIVVGIVAVSTALGIGIGWGVYHATHPPMKGCVITGPNGLELRNEKDQVTYELTGTTTGVQPGIEVKVKGKKKPAKGASSTFRVDKVVKSYGSCSASPIPQTGDRSAGILRLFGSAPTLPDGVVGG